MEFTPEQLDILIKGLSENDFTVAVPLSGVIDNFSEEDAQVYSTLKNNITKLMNNNLPLLDINRHIENFAQDHPINTLINADASFISCESTNIMRDEDQTLNAMNKFSEDFAPIFVMAVEEYCKCKHKREDDLSESELEYIRDTTTNVIVQELLLIIMQGQQLKEINEVAHEYQAHEDFFQSFNTDSINFYNSWTHCKSIVGAMLQLDNEEVKPPSMEDDHMIHIIFESFCDRLSEQDATIFRLRYAGYKQSEIAEKLGFKTQSAVAKRLQLLRKEWDDFTTM